MLRYVKMFKLCQRTTSLVSYIVNHKNGTSVFQFVMILIMCLKKPQLETMVVNCALEDRQGAMQHANHWRYRPSQNLRNTRHRMGHATELPVLLCIVMHNEMPHPSASHCTNHSLCCGSMDDQQKQNPHSLDTRDSMQPTLDKKKQTSLSQCPPLDLRQRRGTAYGRQ